MEIKMTTVNSAEDLEQAIVKVTKLQTELRHIKGKEQKLILEKQIVELMQLIDEYQIQQQLGLGITIG